MFQRRASSINFKSPFIFVYWPLKCLQVTRNTSAFFFYIPHWTFRIEFQFSMSPAALVNRYSLYWIDFLERHADDVVHVSMLWLIIIQLVEPQLFPNWFRVNNKKDLKQKNSKMPSAFWLCSVESVFESWACEFHLWQKNRVAFSYNKPYRFLLSCFLLLSPGQFI